MEGKRIKVWLAWILSLSVLASVLSDTGNWVNDLPPWIERVDKEFGVPNGAENISTIDHDGIIVCLFHLVSTYRPAKPGLSDITFVPNHDFDGSLCTHVICTRLSIHHNIQLLYNNEYDALPVVKQVREKYPNTKFLLDVTVLPGGVYNYIGQPQFQDFKPFDSPTNIDAFENNMKLFVDLIKNTAKENGFQGVHVNQAFYGEDNTANKTRYRAVIKALKSAFKPDNLLLTSDLLMLDGKISDVNEMFDLVMVDPAGRNNDELAKFFFSPDNYLHGRSIRKQNNFVLQIYMFGFLGNFSTHTGNIKRTFINDLFGYNEACQISKDKNIGMELLLDFRNDVAILANGSSGIVMPTPKSVMTKVAFVMTAGLRGVMMRSSPEDDFTPYCGNLKYPLTRTANFAMMSTAKNMKFCYYKYRNLYKNPSILLPLKGTTENIMYALVNTTIELKCDGIGYPDITLSWAGINETLGGAKLISESKVVIGGYTDDCPSNVTKAHTIWVSMTTPGNQIFECAVSSEYGNDSNKITVNTRPKSYLLRNNTILIEEVDLDLNFVLQNGETYWFSNDDAVLFCQLNLFDATSEMKKFINTAGNRVNACTHLVLTSLSWQCDGQMRCPPNPSHEQMEQIIYIRERYRMLKVMVGIVVSEKYSGEWIRSKNNSVLPQLPKGFKLDGIHIHMHNERFRNFSSFMDHVKTLWRLTLESEWLTVGLKVRHDSSITGTDFRDFARNVDFVVVRGYDFNSLQNRYQTGHNSPLNGILEQDDSIRYSLQLLLDTYRIQNILLELSATGFAYELSDNAAMDYFGLQNNTTGRPPVSIGYNQICSIVQSGGGDLHMFYDYVARVPFLKKGSTWISFDSLESIYTKLSYNFGLNSPRGVMLSSIELDNFNETCTKESDGQVSLLQLIQTMIRLPRTTRNSPIPGLDSGLKVTWVEGTIALLLLLLLVTAPTVLLLKYYRNRYPFLTRQDLARFKHGDISINPIKGGGRDIIVVKYGGDDKGGDLKFAEDNYTRIPCREELIVPCKDYEIDFSNILGSGAFGLVLGGTLWGKEVAVKTLPENEEITRSSLLSLMNEIKLMMYLGSHPNIVELLGCDTKEVQKGRLYLFLEFCPMGNLLNFLRQNSSNFKSHPLPSRRFDHNAHEYENVENETTDFDDITLLVWCYQVTHGLAYLAQKKIIHGDLAARNVLLVNINHVKITDFGLSKRLQENYAIYKKTTPTLLPWRWLSPEALTELKFSTRSDVWALGVTMWEVYSMGAVPYPGLGWDISFNERLIEGLRLQPPPLISAQMFGILEECWLLAPEDRADLKTIEMKIKNHVNDHEKHIYSNVAVDCPSKEI